MRGQGSRLPRSEQRIHLQSLNALESDSIPTILFKRSRASAAESTSNIKIT
jgi:hypothetical protein